jgi:hypothetical protein
MSEDSFRRAQVAVQEIERQPWSDIVNWSQGSGSDGQRWDLDYQWRRPSEDQREFLFRMRDQRAAAAASAP